MDKATLHSMVRAKADEIEAELKRLNRWSDTPLPEDKFVNMGAFGANTMAFEQWLQFVLLARIQAITRENGDLPGNSSVGTYAIRELDGDTDAQPLMDRLFELDSLINNA